MILEISNEQDRRTVAAILVANGYTVKIEKVKVSKSTYRNYLSAEKETKKEDNH